MNIISPFGPDIGQASMPEDLNQQLLAICLGNQHDKSRRTNDKLVGLIDKEFDIEPELTNTPIMSFIQQTVINYLSTAPSIYRNYTPLSKFDVRCSGIWCNIQEPGEHNPIHTHPEDVVCVMYPEVNIDTNYQKYTTFSKTPPGALVLNNQLGDNRFGINAHAISPKTAEMYIFPCSLSHYTQPFFKEGDRRISVSCNFVFTEHFFNLHKLRGYR